MDVSATSARLRSSLAQFSTPQKVIIGLLAVVALVVVGTFARWVTAPSYGVLMTGLDATDAAAVTAQLDASGVPYKLEAGGGTVLVPANDLQQQRLAVAAAGLPNGATKGYELLDAQGMTSSSFQQQIAYQRAVEGELSKTLGQMGEVKAATVHLSLPKQELYTDKATPARASVLLDTRSTMAAGSVDAVQRLVAAAVPDLAPEGVTVSDTKGTLLTGAGGAAGGNEAERTLEDAAVTRADSMLASVLGPGKAVVRVNAEMDLASRSTESETYDPKNSVTLRSTKSKETYDAKGQSPGVGGVVSVPDPVAANGTTATGSGSVYGKDDSTDEFGVTRTVDRSTLQPGGVKRLTVAVALDNKTNISPQAVQDLVANAVGVDPKRGDTISVALTTFPKVEAPADAAAAGGRDLMQTGTVGLAGLLLLLTAVGFFLAMRKGTTSEIPLETVALLDGEQGALGAGSTLALEGGSAAEQDARILELVDSRPDEVGALIRNWLAEPADSSR